MYTKRIGNAQTKWHIECDCIRDKDGAKRGHFLIDRINPDDLQGGTVLQKQPDLFGCDRAKLQ
jgi:hypothetical protein